MLCENVLFFLLEKEQISKTQSGELLLYFHVLPSTSLPPPTACEPNGATAAPRCPPPPNAKWESQPVGVDHPPLQRPSHAALPCPAPRRRGQQEAQRGGPAQRTGAPGQAAQVTPARPPPPPLSPALCSPCAATPHHCPVPLAQAGVPALPLPRANPNIPRLSRPSSVAVRRRL